MTFNSEDEDPEYKPLRMPFKDDMDDFTNSPLDDKDEGVEGENEGKLHTDKEGRGWKVVITHLLINLVGSHQFTVRSVDLNAVDRLMALIFFLLPFHT